MDFKNKKYYLVYLTGFFIILALPILAVSPWFFPPEWGKSIVFKSVFSGIAVLFLWQAISDYQLARFILASYKKQKIVFWIVSAILFLTILSAIFSSNLTLSLWGNPHRAGGAIIFIFYLTFSVALSLTIIKADWSKLFDFSFVIAAGTVLFAIFQYFNLAPQFLIPYGNRPPSTLSNPDYFGLYLLLLFFFNIVFAIKEASLKKILYWINVFLVLFGILISGSRSAYLGLVLGSLFFIFFLPLKIKKIKIISGIILLLVIAGVAYVSFSPEPSFIKNNEKGSYFYQRLSLKNALSDITDFRLSGWKIFWQAIKAKPLLGWGPENISSGFDRYYNPAVPNIESTWWDRAHNIFLEMAASYGLIFAVIYLLFFVIIFFKLSSLRKSPHLNSLHPHAAQATLLAYFIALLFGFDSVTTYLTLFFITGYCLYLINEPSQQNYNDYKDSKPNISKKWLFLSKKKRLLIITALILWIFFLWFYNLKPLAINGKINQIEDIYEPSRPERCRRMLNEFEKLFAKKSFLDAYVRLKYVDQAQSCLVYFKDPQIIIKAIEALQHSAKKYPSYTRNWLLAGALFNVLAAGEENPEKRMEFLSEARDYLKKASELSPKRQEIIIEWAKSYFIEEDFNKMKERAKECLSGGGDTSSCHWYLGLSEILLEDKKSGKENLELAKKKGYPYDSFNSYSELAVIYTKTEDYQELAPIYLWLTDFDPKDIQYRATLAFIYQKLGDYNKAIEQALKIIEINPEAKDDVKEFLETIPIRRYNAD